MGEKSTGLVGAVRDRHALKSGPDSGLGLPKHSPLSDFEMGTSEPQHQAILSRPLTINETGLQMGMLCELCLKVIYNAGEIGATEICDESACKRFSSSLSKSPFFLLMASVTPIISPLRLIM